MEKHFERLGLVLKWSLLIWWIAMIMLFVYVQMAQAHQASTGWAYPWACCSDKDCREVTDAKVGEGPAGYTVPSGELIGYGDKRIKDSPDGLYHWCSVAGEETTRTLCLFVPMRLG